MNFGIKFFAAAALCALPFSTARADFIIEFKSVLNQFFEPFGTVDTNAFPPGTFLGFTIQNANTGTWRVYSDNPGVDRLGTISFTGATGRDLKLVIGGPGIDFNPFISAGAPAVLDWIGGVSEGGANVSVQASVGRDIGNLQATAIRRIEAVGAIRSDHKIVDPVPVHISRACDG